MTMKRAVNLLFVVLLLIGCAAPAGPTPENTRRPTVNTVIEVASPTATDEPTFTPIPPTFTLTSTGTPTPTLTSTLTATATKIKATLTRVATKVAATKVPTKVILPTKIPTIFSAPTNPPVVVQPTNPPAQVCCKICRKGKACGDTCIAADKTCHVGPGCACNG